MNDEDYAIVIGVRYRSLPALKATLKDASRFTEWLASDEGGGIPLDSGRIKLILSPRNRTSDRPVQDDIDNALHEFGLHKGKHIGRRLYFYFTGHGFGKMGVASDIGMLMAIADRQVLNSNIGLRKYRALFEETDFFDEVIFILDCCRNSAPEVNLGLLDTNPSRFTPAPNPPDTPVKICTILAAEYGSKAFEPISKRDGERSGLLTKALLEGLTSSAALDDDGNCTSTSLGAFISAKVPVLAEEIGDPNLKQQPQVEGPVPPIVFRQGVSSKVKVRFIAPPKLKGDIVITDHLMNEMERRPAEEARKGQPPWNVELSRNRMYGVTCSEGQRILASDPLDAMRWAEVEANDYEFVFGRSKKS